MGPLCGCVPPMYTVCWIVSLSLLTLRCAKSHGNDGGPWYSFILIFRFPCNYFVPIIIEWLWWYRTEKGSELSKQSTFVCDRKAHNEQCIFYTSFFIDKKAKGSKVDDFWWSLIDICLITITGFHLVSNN